MSMVHGTYHAGRVELDSPVDWREGAKVAVIPESAEFGLLEADWPETPEGRQELLARMDALEPLELTPEDEAEIAAAREAFRRASFEAVRRQMGLGE